MKTFPVTINGEFTKKIGNLELDEEIVINISSLKPGLQLGYLYNKETNEIFGFSIIFAPAIEGER